MNAMDTKIFLEGLNLQKNLTIKLGQLDFFSLFSLIAMLFVYEKYTFLLYFKLISNNKKKYLKIIKLGLGHPSTMLVVVQLMVAQTHDKGLGDSRSTERRVGLPVLVLRPVHIVCHTTHKQEAVFAVTHDTLKNLVEF